MLLARRSFLSGLASALFAPAVVRAESLMPVRAYLDPHAVPGMPGWLFMHGQELRRSDYPMLASVLEFEGCNHDKLPGISGPYFRVPDCRTSFDRAYSARSLIAATGKAGRPIGTEFVRVQRYSDLVPRDYRADIASTIKTWEKHPV